MPRANKNSLKLIHPLPSVMKGLLTIVITTCDIYNNIVVDLLSRRTFVKSTKDVFAKLLRISRRKEHLVDLNELALGQASIRTV